MAISSPFRTNAVTTGVAVRQSSSLTKKWVVAALALILKGAGAEIVGG